MIHRRMTYCACKHLISYLCSLFLRRFHKNYIQNSRKRGILVMKNSLRSPCWMNGYSKWWFSGFRNRFIKHCFIWIHSTEYRHKTYITETNTNPKILIPTSTRYLQKLDVINSDNKYVYWIVELRVDELTPYPTTNWVKSKKIFASGQL